MLRLLPLLASLFILIIIPACGGGGGTGGDGGGAPSNTGSIVVGVVSDLRVGVDFHTMHIVMEAGGKVVRDEVQQAGGTLAIPAELPFENLAADTPIHAEIEAIMMDGTTLVRRVADSKVVAGKKLLLRVALDVGCVLAPGSTASSCAVTETCVAGKCADPFVDPAALAPYVPGWAVTSNDPCKPAGGGAPIVIVGEGQGDYLPTMDGVTAQVEAGPQGGHHIWVAVRVKNLAQSGSITSITGRFPDLGIDIGPFDVIFTFEPDEGGYCKLFGLRFQLDQGNDITGLLGHPLDVTVAVTDPDKVVGKGTRRVVLSSDFLQ